MTFPPLNFCSNCGAKLVLRVPPGDSLPRNVCDNCNTIHYRNPLVVVGTIPVWEDRILLCKRAIEPQYGLWTLPAGFMELGETTSEAALRETEEEAHARVEILGLYTLFNLPEISQVYVLLRGRLVDLDFSPGTQSLEVRLPGGAGSWRWRGSSGSGSSSAWRGTPSRITGWRWRRCSSSRPPSAAPPRSAPSSTSSSEAPSASGSGAPFSARSTAASPR